MFGFLMKSWQSEFVIDKLSDMHAIVPRCYCKAKLSDFVKVCCLDSQRAFGWVNHRLLTIQQIIYRGH